MFLRLCRWHLCNSEKGASTGLVSRKSSDEASVISLKIGKRMFCISHHHCAVRRTDLFFLGFHILLLCLKTDENSVPEVLVKPFCSVTWAFCFCVSSGSLAALPAWHLQSQILAPGSGPFPFFLSSRVANSRAYRDRVVNINCEAGSVEEAAHPVHTPSEGRAALTQFLTDRLTSPRAARHPDFYGNLPNL